MKKADILTGLIVPKGSRYNYTEADREARNKFETDLITFLGLPENWKDYFQLKSSDDFMTLCEKGSYSLTPFRRFKRGKEATIPANLKERLQEWINDKNETSRLKDEQREREVNYQQSIAFLLTEEVTDGWHISYRNENQGLNVRLFEERKSVFRDSIDMQEVANIYIRHTGEITEPDFETSMRYRITLNQAMDFIRANQAYHNKLMTKAHSIKAQLPESFFKPKTVTA